MLIMAQLLEVNDCVEMLCVGRNNLGPQGVQNVPLAEHVRREVLRGCVVSRNATHESGETWAGTE